MTGQGASQETVPVHFLSAALDEVWALRGGCAYEALGNRATSEMKVPAGARAVLGYLNDQILVPAALGQARLLRPEATIEREEWEQGRNLRRIPQDDERDGANLRLYLTALDEIASLRAVLTEAVGRMEQTLAFKTVPSSRRRIMQRQVERMTDAQSGLFGVYQWISPTIIKHALRECGAPETLTASSFAASYGALS